MRCSAIVEIVSVTRLRCRKKMQLHHGRLTTGRSSEFKRYRNSFKRSISRLAAMKWLARKAAHAQPVKIRGSEAKVD
jgi:hypothetical protein